MNNQSQTYKITFKNNKGVQCIPQNIERMLEYIVSLKNSGLTFMYISIIVESELFRKGCYD